MMHMSLYWSVDLGPVVFDWWRTDSVGWLVVSCLVLAGLATASEFVSRCALRESPSKAKPAVYALKCLLSIFLMLALMSFNGWAIASIVLGYVIGYCLLAEKEEYDLSCLC